MATIFIWTKEWRSIVILKFYLMKLSFILLLKHLEAMKHTTEIVLEYNEYGRK